MKQKLISLLTLLVLCVTGALAQDPTLSVEFTSTTKTDWLKNWSTEGITLSGDGSFTSSSGYYYGGCSSNASSVDGKYFGIAVNSSAQKIVKVSILVSPNNSNHAFPVFVGWSETPALKNVSCFSAIEGSSTTNTKAGSEWITFDLNAAGVKDNIQYLRIYRKVSAGNFFESEDASKSIGDGKDLGAGVTLRIWAVKVWLADLKTISSQTLTGVKVGGSALTENAVSNGYSIEGTTITLSNDIQSLLAPTNITLTNHIVYSDSSVEDDNVNVTFGSTPADGYYSGTATIDETEYTVKVKKDVTPTIEATTSSVTVSSVTVGTGSQVFTVTGVNLEGDKVNLAFASDVDGLTVSPASIDVVDGAVSQEVTVSYKSNDAVAASNVNLTISSTGVSDIVIPVTYSSTAAITTITDVTGEKTWNFVTAADDPVADISSPDNTRLIPMANATGFADGFDFEALSAHASYFYRASNKCWQGRTVMFHTTVPGIVEVKFSNTGGSQNRSVKINGTSGNAVGADGAGKDNATATGNVDAGDVIITGYNVSGESGADVRIYSITFTPATTTVRTNAGMWASFTPSWNATLEDGATAYIITGVDGDAITASTVGVLEAGEGYFVKGDAANNDYTATATSEAATATDGNLIVGCTEATNINADGNAKYVLGTNGSGESGLFWVNSAVTVPAGKAYLQTTSATARQFLSLDFDEVVTGIETVEAKKSLLDGEFFNLKGQRVAQPQKGLYILNGKKVVLK